MSPIDSDSALVQMMAWHLPNCWLQTDHTSQLRDLISPSAKFQFRFDHVSFSIFLFRLCDFKPVMYLL